MGRKLQGEPCTHCKRGLERPGSNSRLAGTWDHYPVPRCNGGSKTVPCCSQCNAIKADMDAEAWQNFMLAFPEWWKLDYYRNHGKHQVHKQKTFYNYKRR